MLGNQHDRPSNLLHKSGAVAMVFGPGQRRGSQRDFLGGNFLHIDGFAEDFGESEPNLPETNMAMENLHVQ